MNKAILIGRLTADPETRTTQSGVSVCKFTLAVDRRFRDADGNRQADFIPVIAWRQLADLCERYLAKGNKCAVVGSIQTRTYDAQDGSKRYVTELVADEVEFLTPKADGGAGGAPAAAPSGGHVSDETIERARDAFGGALQEIDDDELPF